MFKELSINKSNFEKIAVTAWIISILVFFFVMTVIIFPILTLEDAPVIHETEGFSGYTVLPAGDNSKPEMFKLAGQWEFYPNKLYSFSDFTNGNTIEPVMVRFPDNWAKNPAVGGESKGYATYRMRVRIPEGFSGIGLYSRYQHSAYEIYLNDVLICSAGTVSENPDEHIPVYLPLNGYNFAAIGSEGRTFSVIVRIQNEDNYSGGLSGNIYIGSSAAVKTLRVILIMINGCISGGLFILFICLALTYLCGRERREYLDYTVVALVTVFLSLTSGGESLMYSVGINSITLVRLEYCAIITGAFFANFSVLKEMLKPKIVFRLIYVYLILSILFFLFAPLAVTSRIRIPIIAISISFFLPALFNSIKNTIIKHDFYSITSLISYLIVFTGIGISVTGKLPWDSVDLFSLSILLHCIIQMLMFLYRYRKTELTLKNMTETLEERIVERTIELTLTKEKAEAATVVKSNFLATMSHEIRTPMNAIIGISDLIRTDNLDDTQKSYLLDIKKSSKALLQIINDILDFSKIEAGKFEIIPVHFNLMEVYDNVCSICRFSADLKGLEFRNSIAPDVPQHIYGDEVRCRQIIINVLNNAVKYTKDGYVNFTVKITDLYGLPFLTFIVEDTGIGIKEDDFPRLFNSFEQLDSKSNRKIVGTGLGLSISRQLIALMEGDIQVESEYGKGTTFKIYLPLVEGDPEKIVTQDSFVTVVAKDADVLVVDDNQINLTVALGFLASHNIHADTASSGLEAIEKIKGKSYDLVFMDHMMPEIDGVETTKMIRSMDDGHYVNLPIIALTANAVAGIKDFFIESGMNDFLSKPIEAAGINAILAQWLPLNKVTFEEPQKSKNADKDINAIVEKMYGIKGLDVSLGLSHVAYNKSTYLSVIKQFCKDLDNDIDVLKSSLESGNLKNYSIRAHAMKSVFANIGIEDLSALAHTLELASRDGDMNTCKTETESFCQRMSDYREEFLPLVKSGEEKNKTSIISREDLFGLLTELSTACLLGDSDNAERIAGTLLENSYNDDVDVEITALCEMVESYDFEIAGEKIEQIAAIL